MSTGRFIFTVTDAARFLGKSPVTLRGWERKGEATFPRDEGGDRKLTTTNMRDLTERAIAMGRISMARYNLVHAALTLIEIVERENGL